jgi:major intracellular serine protease
MRKEISNTDKNKSEASQKDLRNDRSEATKSCWILPCCEDRGPNGPGAYRVEKLVLGTSEIIDWGLTILKIPDIWKKTEGEDIKVAVLDSGIAFEHFDFSERNPYKPYDRIGHIQDKRYNLPDAILNIKDFTGSLFGVSDLLGHGTHVAGIIAARKNSTGVVGVAPKAKLLIGKVLGDKGRGSHEALAEGIWWAIKQKADIISMSLGSSEENEEVHKAIQDAYSAGIFLICAAGNKVHKGQNLEPGDPEKESLDFPAKFDETIAVGAINCELKVPYYSPEHEVDIAAPGDQITSSYPPQICAVLSGTSMAAAFVSGLVALILSKHRKYDNEGKSNRTKVKTREQLIEHLMRFTVEADSIADDPRQGFDFIKP